MDEAKVHANQVAQGFEVLRLLINNLNFDSSMVSDILDKSDLLDDIISHHINIEIP